ncbi:ABC-type uncharacterized transport system, ATPase component [Thermobacillus composti KWC4]|uniref:ABC-type uncharacterized transport system, ATPase component n=1 Tax=Thermobacillus composti (strain DSM 18247 / JCM 13945 / KWC4) TaxID=717605 RepID=L0EI48_THECK|nr:ATP-binding cassette domain-containing protein [Thermobacillus composti]AGA59356.1 ABC-type uncharacterized transport system, ATPase component [Thermobacillus composti KWC4]
MLALEVEGLVKTFRVKRKPEGFKASVRSLLRPEWTEKTAVAGIRLKAEAGETLAFLGPNGAGKSTTIKMLTGILHPSSGHARVLGMVPWKERAALAFRIGAVFGQKSQLWYHLPPADTFELLSRMYELGRADYLRRRDELVERFELGPYMQTPVRKLSLGERMRCEIAAAFLHRPELLFLDEPTIGLDVIVKRRIRELIAERNREEGTTVFLTSHDPSDIEQLCRRAVVIHHGSVIFDAPVERLKREVLNYKTVHLKLRNGARLPEKLPDGVRAAEAGPSAWRLSVDTTAASIEDVLAAFIGHCAIEDMTVEDPPMEDVIRAVYEGGSGRPPAEEGAAS